MSDAPTLLRLDGTAGATWPSARFLGILATTLALSAALLRFTDSVPAWLRGEPRGVREYGSLDALERDIRTRLLLPAFFPDTLEWPPERVALSAGDGTPALVAFRDRQRSATGLVIAQAVGGDHPIPGRLLPPVEVLETTDVRVHDASARLSRVRDRRGTPWSELTWVTQGRRVVMRFSGPDAQLIRLARSLHRGRP